jgi:hypothetical protein
MARTGTFGSGDLSPFGGAGTDFGVFNIGESAAASAAAKTVSVQEAASLAFAIERERHDAGLMTDAAFASIQASYLGGLDGTTVAGATAQYTIAMAQYTNERNALAQAVQTGQADPRSLMAFDESALSQVVQGSTEYYQRQDRLWASQGAVFQQDESLVLDNLNDGRITNLQAQDWYAQQAGVFPQNYQIQMDIKNKITQFSDRIVADSDKTFAAEWNKGNLTVSQVISYVAAAQQADPGGNRATELGQFAMDARLQVQESSMKYRYDLTREYAQLTQLIASSEPSKGGTSTSTSTRTFWNGTQWVAQTSTSTKQNAPTKAMVAANAQRLVDIANAKARMTQIKSVVGNIAGGWVTEQDYIRNLTAQQGSQAKGSPGWYALQQQIDGYQQRIDQDKINATLGLRVAYPKVASELWADVNSPTGLSERPVGTGLTTAQINQVQGWNATIGKLQESIATGTLTEEQMAQATADIAKNKGYISGALTAVPKAAPVVAAPKTTAAGGGGGGGGGTVAARTGTGSTTSIATAKNNGGAFGPLQLITSDKLLAAPKGPIIGQTFAGDSVTWRAVQTTPTGLPKMMSPSAFDDFHSSFVAAIKNGDPSFVDRTTNAVYAIPLDPGQRLDMLRYMDDRKIELTQRNLATAMANPKSSDSYIAGKKTTVYNAYANAQTNILWVLNTSNAGTVKDASGKAIKLGGSEAGTAKSNSLAFAVDLIDVSVAHAESHFKIAQTYFDRGDYTAAAGEINAGRAVIDHVAIGPDGKTGKGSLLSVYADQANATVANAISAGGKVPSEIATDLKRLNNFGVEMDAPNKGIDKTAVALFGPDGKEGTGILTMANGFVQANPNGGALLNPGFMRYINTDGTVTAKLVKATGSEKGQPTYGNEKGRVVVMVKMGAISEPMSAEYQVGRVGEMTISGEAVPIMGKVVTVGQEVWMESPFAPGKWIPMNGTSTTRFTAPAGSQSGVNPPGKDNIPGLAAGASFVQFTRSGVDYLLSPNAAGGYDLYENTKDGAQLIGNGGTAAGTVDQNYARIVNGFGYDQTTLTSDQRTILNLTDKRSGAAWIGSSAQDIADRFKRQQAERATGEGFDIWQMLNRPAAPSNLPPTPTTTSRVTRPGGLTSGPQASDGPPPTPYIAPSSLLYAPKIITPVISGAGFDISQVPKVYVAPRTPTTTPRVTRPGGLPTGPQASDGPKVAPKITPPPVKPPSTPTPTPGVKRPGGLTSGPQR